MRDGRPTRVVCRVLLPACLAFGTEAFADDSSVVLLRLGQDLGGARAMGLGWALAGLSDDANAGRGNPAGLSTIPRSFDLAIAQGTGERATPTFFAVAFSPWRRVSTSLDWGRSERTDLVSALRGPGSSPTSSSSGPSASASYRFGGRFSAGATVAAQRLYVSGGGQGEDLAATDWSMAWALGLMFFPYNPDVPRVGVVYRPAQRWDLDTPSGGGMPRRVRTPSMIAAGVSWHYDLRDTRLLLSLEQDVIRYSELGDTVAFRAPPDIAPHDDLDFRAGAELWVPLGRCRSGCGGMIQVRGAIVSRAPPPFATRGRAGAPGQGLERTTQWYAGVTGATRRVFSGRLKLEVAYRSEMDVFSFGIGFRYPEAYRADLEDHH